MTILVAVPYETYVDENGKADEFDGDTILTPDLFVPYEEGATFGDLREMALDAHAKSFDMTREEYDEEFSEDPTVISGFWIVDQTTHRAITKPEFSVGNDSALYAMIRMQKLQIFNASIKTITDK